MRAQQHSFISVADKAEMGEPCANLRPAGTTVVRVVR